VGNSFGKYRTALLAAAAALALPAGIAAMMNASHDSSTWTISAAGLQTPAAATPFAGSPSSAGRVVNAPGASPTATPQAPPKIVEKPPPVVDGVRRANVGSAHSPRIQQQLSTAPPATPPPADAGTLGVDVADYQHQHGAAIDWPQVAAAGYKFAFIKATEGDYYVNPYYPSDLAEAKAAGLYVAGYHFAVPNVSGGASQADYAVQNVGYFPDGRTLPVALDIEYNPYGEECYGLSATQMVAWLAAFTAEAQRLTGQLPVIYTTADWWRTCTGDNAGFGADPLWVAAYGSASPPMPAGWGSWTFWQYTSRASVPGISGHVDVSYFLRAAMRLLDPGNQQDAAGTAIQLQVTSLNAAAGQSPQFTALGLPPGLSIDGGGLITGKISATAAGTYAVTVTADDPSGGTGSVSFLWTVTPAAPSPPPATSPTPPASVPPTSGPPPVPSPTTSIPPPVPSPSPPSPAPPTSATPSPTPPPPPQPPPTPTPTPTPSDTSPPPPTPTPSDTPPSPAPSPTPTPSDTPPSPAPSPTPTPSDTSQAAPSPSPTPSDTSPATTSAPSPSTPFPSSPSPSSPLPSPVPALPPSSGSRAF
jgi:GH25 family lysozyme M1 (1,4-beta-N-acetylmuramidase)